MNSQKQCPQCGAELSPDASEDLSTRCLMQGGLGSSPTTPGQSPPGKTIALSPADLPTEAAAPTTAASSLPRIRYFGDFELLEEIGSGGMGVVYKARQVNLNRLVALKMIRSGKFAGQSEVKRFQVEAEAAANLNHPDIVTIYEVGQHEGHHYLAMELVEGCTLAELIAKNRSAWDHSNAALLVAKVARAVHHAHAQGILHRDLKPGNILVDKMGEPHVADFGLARRLNTDSGLTLEGDVMGTPSFMAPEQAAGKTKQLSAAADIYSLGAILYYLLTGRPPFVAESAMDIMVQVLEGEAIRPRTLSPSISADLEGICLRCLEKSPVQRYVSAAALAEDLERYLRGENVDAESRGIKSLLKQWIRRQPALCSHLSGLALCTVIAQVNFHFQDVVPLALHLKIMTLLGLWTMLSVLCQLGMRWESWASSIRFLWCGIDAVLLTVLLWLDEATSGPLMSLYPALIAASGLWFRVRFVLFTTAISLLGYGCLLINDYWIHGRIVQFNWHLIVMVMLASTGLVIAYQVHRVRALSRFYEHRPLD
jgi:eukaryotic-like serine/threonine-protein kinase